MTQDKDAWYKKGLNLADEGKHQEALICFEEALLLDPKDAVIWGRRGAVLYHLGRYESAINSFNKALAKNTKDIVSWRLKGFALEKVGRKEEAKKCFEKVREIQLEEIAREHSTKTSNIYTCARCGGMYICENKSIGLRPACYHKVKEGDELLNPFYSQYYSNSIDEILDTDHYE